MDLKITGFADYELLDSGAERKLERFGDMVLDRPCAQAIWPKSSAKIWPRADAIFERSQGGAGDWIALEKKLPDSWPLELEGFTFEIRLANSGNVGIFPEHTAHWPWITDLIRQKERAEILNLFAYTGGVSMVCAAAGATVTHVDAARSVNSWAMLNIERSGLSGREIRFLTDDALKLLKRDSRRTRRYDGIIIDPPTFGRGPKGEVWKIERDLYPLLECCFKLLSDTPLFVLLTAHSPGITPSVLHSLLLLGKGQGKIQAGEMELLGKKSAIPAGAYARWQP